MAFEFNEEKYKNVSAHQKPPHGDVYRFGTSCFRSTDGQTEQPHAA
jgi:hypothetical protein